MTIPCSLLQALNPVAGLTVQVLVQIVSFRMIARLGLLRSLITGFFAGLMVVIAGEIWFCVSLHPRLMQCAALTITNVATYGFLGYCYFNFINLGVTSRRFRILRELLSAPEGLTRDEILSRYNARYQIDIRIDRLVGSGQLLVKNGRYYIGKRTMLMITRIMYMLKKIIIGKTEFD